MANCQAEFGLCMMKKIIRDNVMLTRKMDTEYTRAFVEYRNTKDRDTNRSLTEFLIGGEPQHFLPKSRKQLMGKGWNCLVAKKKDTLANLKAKLRRG